MQWGRGDTAEARSLCRAESWRLFFVRAQRGRGGGYAHTLRFSLHNARAAAGPHTADQQSPDPPSLPRTSRRSSHGETCSSVYLATAAVAEREVRSELHQWRASAGTRRSITAKTEAASEGTSGVGAGGASLS
eukprot:scaffold21470_cov90-Isochrysis_galbana.AAC.1